MKCEYSIINDRGIISFICIEKNNVFFMERDEKQFIDVNDKNVINTLVCLYALRNSWEKKDCENPVYQVVFGDGEIYKFDVDNKPDNFIMFTSFISKLVGDVI